MRQWGTSADTWRCASRTIDFGHDRVSNADGPSNAYSALSESDGNLAHETASDGRLGKPGKEREPVNDQPGLRTELFFVRGLW
jgi:hypothetical protein